MQCLNINDYTKKNGTKTCPQIQFEIMGTKNIKCIDGSPRFGFIVSNSCQMNVDIGLNVSTIIPNLNLNMLN